MAAGRKKKKSFEALTWADLEAWAGNKIVSRGKSYQRQGRVKDLALTIDGKLIASVRGSETYASVVYIEGRDIESACTCPYWDDCKHAVAAVLEYLDCIKNGREVTQIGNGDQRLQVFEENIFAVSPVNEEKSGRKDRITESLDSFLGKQKKDSLTNLIKELAERYPDVRASLMDRQALSGGSIKGMVDRIRADIYQLAAEPVYRDYWDDDQEDLPDYSRIGERLEALLGKGHAEEVLSLGKKLLEAGTNQIGISHDEGELAWAIGECMEIVFRALPMSVLSPAEQMLWAVEAEMMDEYRICDAGLESFWKTKKKKADWAILAENLMERLTPLKPVKVDDVHSKRYERERFTDWIVEALQKAGWTDKAIEICKKEVPITASYVRLVRLLRGEGRREDAKNWIRKGIKATQKRWPGIARDLRGAFREMQEKGRNWPGVAAIRAEDFFLDPSLFNFKSLAKAAKKAKAWKEIRASAMHYLESGDRPDNKELAWPLPKTGLPEQTRRGNKRFPLFDVLIDIAIHEKRPDDVIKWHDAKPRENRFRRFNGHENDKIAEAVRDQYPERALEIWKGIAENEIDQTKVKAYQVAGRYLRKIQKLFKTHDREKDWIDYIGQLRRAHARKPRFIEILDGLSGKRIVDA